MIATPQPKAKPYSAGYIPHPTPHGDEYDDDTLMSKEELFATINSALEEVAQGKCRVINSDEELRGYFASL
jgi:hypothetical protein